MSYERSKTDFMDLKPAGPQTKTDKFDSFGATPPTSMKKRDDVAAKRADAGSSSKSPEAQKRSPKPPTMSQKMREVEDYEDNRYANARSKLKEAADHFDHHSSPKIKRKAMAATKDHGAAPPDKLEQLKDQNYHLKRRQGELDTDIKIISTQLRRMIDQLKGDKQISGRAVQFEKQLDSLIEDQFHLKEEEQSLMKKVRTAQKKLEAIDAGSASRGTKTVGPAFGGGKSGTYGNIPTAPKSSTTNELRGPTGQTIAQESQLKILKEQLQNCNKTIQGLRH